MTVVPIYQIRNNVRVSTPGELLRTRRLAHGLTQERLARRAGTTQAAISRIERGNVSPTFETFSELMLSLGEAPELTSRALEPELDRARLSALRERDPSARVELAFSWNRLAGEIAEAGARARGAP